MSLTCVKERRSRTCSCVNQGRTNRQHQVKKLRIHRKRIHLRGEGRGNRRTESEYSHCCHGISEDSRKCCTCKGNSKRDQIFSKFFPFAHEHSIITERRLIGHQGLFNHEVKSFDIERCLSDQLKLDKAGKKGEEMGHTLLNQSAALCISSPFSSNNLFVHDAVLSTERIAASSLYSIADGQEDKRHGSHKSDLMTSPQLYPSSESFKSCFSSKHSSTKEVVTMDKGNSVSHQKEKYPFPSVVRHSSQKCSQLPAQQFPSSGFSLQRPSLDPGLRGECLASVSIMAAQLCESVDFAYLNRTDMLAESLLVLQRVLKAKHGTQLHDNLLRNQQSSIFGADSTRMEQYNSLKPALIDDNVLSAEASTYLFNEPAGYVSQENEALINTDFVPWTVYPYLQIMAPEQPTNLVDTSPIHSDIPRPRSHTPLFVFPELNEKSARGYLFAPLLASNWQQKPSLSQNWKQTFNRPETKVSFVCALNESSSVTKAGHVSHLLKDTHIQQFSYSPSPTERHFNQETFKSDKYNFSSPFCNQVYSPYISRYLQSGPLLSSFHSGTKHYPSSYMLSKTPPLFPLHSSDHWSFPPMKMY